MRRCPAGRSTFETRLKFRNDQERFFAVTYLPYVEDPGMVRGFIAAIADVTLLRGVEEQLRHSQKLDSVGRLAGGVAHDFNNLLMAINIHCERALEQLPSEDPIRDAIEEVRKNSARASTLTRQLLAFSRKQVLQPKVIDVNSVVSEIDKMLRRVIGEDIELVSVFGEKLWHVQADLSQLEQVLLNLAVNARDAMPKGGKLTLETANVQLKSEHTPDHEGVPPGDYVMMAARDSGKGMDAQTKANIFEPFFTTKGVGEGTGLGLSTVFGVVKQSNGHIRVDSTPGKERFSRSIFLGIKENKKSRIGKKHQKQEEDMSERSCSSKTKKVASSLD